MYVVTCTLRHGTRNEILKMSQYHILVDRYTRALNAKEAEPFKILSNRSQAYNCLQQYREALRDADESIKLKPSYAPGYLQKCTALIGLESYKDAMAAAQEGYKLSGDGSEIANECVHRWIEADQRYCDLWESQERLFGERFEHDRFSYIAASGACYVALACFDLANQCGTKCDLNIANDVIKELLQENVFKYLPHKESPQESPPLPSTCSLAKALWPKREQKDATSQQSDDLCLLAKKLVALQLLDLQSMTLDLLMLDLLALDLLFKDLDGFFEKFGYAGRSEILTSAQLWLSLLHSCRVETKSWRVSVSISDKLLSVSWDLCQHLKAVDDTLHPVIRPILSLAMLVMYGHCQSLNFVNENLHTCQLFCQTGLVFFEETDFLRDFKELQLLLHMQCLSAWAQFYDTYTEAEESFLQDFVRVTEACIKRCPQSYIKEEASIAVSAAKVRLYPDSVNRRRDYVVRLDGMITKEPQLDIMDVVKDAMKALNDHQQLKKSMEHAEILVENIGKIHVSLITATKKYTYMYNYFLLFDRWLVETKEGEVGY